MADDERRAEIEAVKAALEQIEECASEGESWLFIAQKAREARAILDRVRDARGDDEATRNADTFIGTRMGGGERGDWQFEDARSPQGEDHEAAIPPAILAEMVERFRFVVAAKQHSPEATAESAVEAIVEPLLPLLSPSRDGTVAVEDVAEWLRRTSANPEDPWGVYRKFLAEFARPATGEQTDHGGNQ